LNTGLSLTTAYDKNNTLLPYWQALLFCDACHHVFFRLRVSEVIRLHYQDISRKIIFAEGRKACSSFAARTRRGEWGKYNCAKIMNFINFW